MRFRVDGERFEILEQTLRAKGDTFLVTVLDDPWRDDAKEICDLGTSGRKFFLCTLLGLEVGCYPH